MAQIITYHVLQGPNSDALAGLVQKAIKEGWQPHGSLAVSSDKSGTTYSQPIVQYLPEPPIQPQGGAVAVM